MMCGGVLVPKPHPVTGRYRRCFVEEAHKDEYTERDLLLEMDHFIPKSMGGANGPTHLAHQHCQEVQGGLLGQLVLTPEGRRKGGLRYIELYGSSWTAEGRRKGNHNRWHVTAGKPCTCKGVTR